MTGFIDFFIIAVVSFFGIHVLAIPSPTLNTPSLPPIQTSTSDLNLQPLPSPFPEIFIYDLPYTRVKMYSDSFRQDPHRDENDVEICVRGLMNQTFEAIINGGYEQLMPHIVQQSSGLVTVRMIQSSLYDPLRVTWGIAWQVLNGLNNFRLVNPGVNFYYATFIQNATSAGERATVVGFLGTGSRNFSATRLEQDFASRVGPAALERY